MPSPPPPSARERDILTPSRLTALARELLEGAFPLIWVEGELSRVSRPASGHLYFTLKDPQAQVACVMYRSRSQLLRFRPAEGMHVLLRARVSLYEPRGEFQLTVDHLEEAGEGALRREFERLKAKRADEGLLEAARKRALPRLARRIGVITSASGAAVRDVVSVVARRFPLARLEVLPVPVQGAEAPPRIVAMLERAQASGRYDVLLLTRGGGSLEDLWAFNDEGLVRAIFHSAVPVVSAIGHEIDFTLADFVADLRAPTPSAAAELLVPNAAELMRHLGARRDALGSGIERALRNRSQRLDAALARLSAAAPARRLENLRTRLTAVGNRIAASRSPLVERRQQRLALLRVRLDATTPRARLARHRERLAHLGATLRARAQERTVAARARLTEMARTLHAVGPLATLERGYAILLRPDGSVLRSASGATTGDKIEARLADGTLRLHVDGSDPP